MNHSEQINEIAGALAKAQGVIKNALKSADNPFFHSTYADLASVWDACREPLAENGIAVVQSPEYVNETNTVVVETMLMHSSGQWLASQLTGIPVKEVNEMVDGRKERKEVESRTPQAIGSCITYLRRYALAAFVGVAPEDDDGNVASGRENGEAQARPEGEIDLKMLKCPKCGRLGAIIKGKPEYGGGYVCWKKEGGCGKNFAVNDADLFPPKEARVDTTPHSPSPLLDAAKKQAEKAAASPQEAPKAETPAPDTPRPRGRPPKAVSAPATPSPEPALALVPAAEAPKPGPVAVPNPVPASAEPPKPKEINQEVSRKRGDTIEEIIKLTNVTPQQLAIKLDRLCGGDPADAKEASAHLRNAKPQHIDASLESLVLLARKHGDKVRDVILEENPEPGLVEELKKMFDERIA